MTESTTPADNPTNGDAVADSTTSTDPNAGTDNQPDQPTDGQQPDSSSKSTDSSADGDKSTDGGNADDAPASPKLDDDLADWAAKRGFPEATTDEQRAAYQTQRDEQREFTRTRQADKAADDAKALGKEINDAKPEPSGDDDDELDPLEKRQNAVEAQLKEERTTRLQSEFYNSNSVTPEQHEALLSVFKEKTTSPGTPEGRKRAFELWSDPDALPDLLDLAKAKMAKGSDTSVIEDEAARKEREKIARESHANSPGRGAKAPTSSDKTEEQKRLDRFSNWD